MTITNEDKVCMLVAHAAGATLTEIGEEFGVSRKTVRRRIDEVQAFYDNISVGDTVVIEVENENVGVVVMTKDNPITDEMPIALKFGDGVVDYVELYQLMDAAEREVAGQDIIDEVEEDENTPLKIGDRVRIRKTSRFYGDCYGNPTNQTGTVKATNEGRMLPVLVDWDEDGYNSYTFEDLYLYVETVPEAVEEVSEAMTMEEENAQYFVTAPQDSLTIVRIDQDTGEVSQRQTNKHNENFVTLRNLIKEDQSQETLRDVYNALDTTRMLESYSVGRVKVNPETESVVFVKADGYERAVPDDIAMDIITTVREYGRDQGEKLVKFLDKLMDNVSFKAIEGLYRFMKHNCIEINDDGSIQAWKGVRPDMYSNHAGKIKSSPTVTVRDDGRIYNGNFGTEIRVDRSEVNDDPDVTCSHGLHVGNREYASGFAQKLLAVRVEPQDVVAVPKDYNGAKMRCCAYTPLYAV